MEKRESEKRQYFIDLMFISVFFFVYFHFREKVHRTELYTVQPTSPILFSPYFYIGKLLGNFVTFFFGIRLPNWYARPNIWVMHLYVAMPSKILDKYWRSVMPYNMRWTKVKMLTLCSTKKIPEKGEIVMGRVFFFAVVPSFIYI